MDKESRKARILDILECRLKVDCNKIDKDSIYLCADNILNFVETEQNSETGLVKIVESLIQLRDNDVFGSNFLSGKQAVLKYYSIRPLEAVCKQEKEAEKERTALSAQVEELREGLGQANAAIAEYYRYWTGGETRGSYDGKPERAGLWNAHYAARTLLAKHKETK